MGISHPPAKYWAKQYAWKRMTKWQDAVVEGLFLAGVTAPKAEVVLVVKEIASPKGRAELKEKPHSNVLYHPADRNTFMVFDNEPEIAEICRRFDRNLVVAAPEINDQAQWPRIYNQKDVDRPAIRTRWGPGVQGEFRPIYLGCLPYSDNAVEWYTVQPHGTDNEKTWKNLWAIPAFDQQGLQKFNFPHPDDSQFDESRDPQLFAWALVSLQRSIVAGVEIPDNQTGNWLHQYGRFLSFTSRRDNDFPEARRFVFDHSKNYTGTHLSLLSMSTWILASAVGSDLRKYAEQWDTAILALYEIRAALTRGQWPKDDKEQLSEWRKKLGKICEVWDTPEDVWTQHKDHDAMVQRSASPEL
ncbi:hypothetical protein M3J09_000812 [Ascochyta lentis]